MGKFFLKQLFLLVPTLIGISLIAFALVRMIPGDPALLMLGERGGDAEQYIAMKRKLGLDRPLYQQYFIFMGKALSGDLGTSTTTQKPVMEEFFIPFPRNLRIRTLRPPYGNYDWNPRRCHCGDQTQQYF